MSSLKLDRFSRTVAVGLTAAELWFVVSLLVMDWVATVAAHRGADGALLSGLGNLVSIAGTLSLARVRPDRLRALQLLGAGALLVGGYVIALTLLHSAQGTNATTAASELSLFKFALIGATVVMGPGLLPIVLAPLMLVLLGLTSAALGPAHGYRWAFDGYAFAVTIMVVIVTLGTLAAQRIGGATRRQVEALFDEDAAQGRRTEAQSQASVMMQDTLLNDLSVLATLGPGPLPARLGTSLREMLQLLSSPDRRDGEAPPGGSVKASSGVQRAIDEAVGGGLVVRVIGEIATLEHLDGTTGDALGRAVEECLTNTIRHAATDEAEITVLSDDGEEEVSIMVVESGTGTDRDGVDDSDGLRTAVEDRIESVGGTVLVFSRAGVGTTVLLTVPRDSPLVGSGR